MSSAVKRKVLLVTSIFMTACLSAQAMEWKKEIVEGDLLFTYKGTSTLPSELNI